MREQGIIYIPQSLLLAGGPGDRMAACAPVQVPAASYSRTRYQRHVRFQHHRLADVGAFA